MSYHTTDGDGLTELSPSRARLADLLDALDADENFPEVTLSHDNGWSLTAYASGVLVLEHLDRDDAERILRDVPRPRVLSLWLSLARGDLATVRREPWQRPDEEED